MSSSKRLNILIYSGPGTTPTSIRHATYTLRLLLGSRYAITTITDIQLLKEPWSATCALLVIPGGADMSYCRTLDGQGNRIIKQYVQLGGSYLGLCAGGYYGSGRCEFEIGKRGMEVAGDRELAFFPGVCRGLAFPGFKYGREDGALAVKLKANGKEFKSYYNGGGLFVDAEKYKDRGVEVLATFAEDVAVEIGEDKEAAAVVLCKVGDGRVVLTGPHPEFAPSNLNRANYNNPSNSTLVDDLIADEPPRIEFLKSMLKKLGLEVNESTQQVPSLSHLHLSSARPTTVAELVHAWQENGIISKDENGAEWIRGENDTFAIVAERRRWSMGSLSKAASEALRTVKTIAADAAATATTVVSEAVAGKENLSPNSQADTRSSSRNLSPGYDAQTKYIVPHEDAMPDAKETPYFNHYAYYANLNSYASQNCREAEGIWGRHLLYGEVVTSTSTLLEKNPSLLTQLPDGFTATATTQVSGRGRGSNVWVSPPGALMFSTVLRHSLALSNTAPVVFVQYLAALAIVAGIHGYSKGYEKLPVKLKWPNDIYALDPSKPEKENAYVKIAGILVNSSYAGGDYTLVVGIGMNVNNASPSVSLSQLATKSNLPPFTLEKLLASILTHFEELYTRFCRTGFDAKMENLYYESWLHTDQIVTMETEGGARARIKGITRDWGLLVAEEVGESGWAVGRRFELMSDSNSFDFFRGLLRKKV